MGAFISYPVSLQQGPTGKLYLGGNQEDLVHNVWTLVELNLIPDEFIDDIENVGTHRITPGVPGWYLATFNIVFVNAVIDKKYGGEVKINDGITLIQEHRWSHDNRPSVRGVDIVYLDSDDFVSLYAISLSNDNTVDIYAGDTTYGTYLTLQRVR